MTEKRLKITLNGDVQYTATKGNITMNSVRTYKELGIPVGAWLELSDEPLEGGTPVHKLEETSTYTWYGDPARRDQWSLEFCNHGLTNFFGSVPEVIYWRIPHETH